MSTLNASLPSLKFGPQVDVFPAVSTSLESNPFEYSIHSCPKQFHFELKLIFPSLTKSNLQNLFIIPTFQKTKNPLIAYSKENDIERDVLLESFYSWGRQFVSRLADLGYWADIVCPASGLPVFSSSGSTIYPEVECCKKLLRYQTYNIGACNIICHPSWDVYNYPASAFVSAPLSIITQVIDEMKANA
ncbi:hypothetical protein BB560_000589 [Smittium megazygosporum]|uniref:Methylmalonic aciduria and homocystinuria type D protein n=1 Tax=Smittium megazygosporum TaxID=133381 RepID=A0A2T9ZJV5_9FUNG|nr:hypothetical protein BB560_000589 [Smittium megazygosporum]